MLEVAISFDDSAGILLLVSVRPLWQGEVVTGTDSSLRTWFVVWRLIFIPLIHRSVSKTIPMTLVIANGKNIRGTTQQKYVRFPADFPTASKPGRCGIVNTNTTWKSPQPSPGIDIRSLLTDRPRSPALRIFLSHPFRSRDGDRRRGKKCVYGFPQNNHTGRRHEAHAASVETFVSAVKTYFFQSSSCDRRPGRLNGDPNGTLNVVQFAPTVPRRLLTNPLAGAFNATLSPGTGAVDEPAHSPKY